MALILKKLVQGYFWIFNDLRDTRADVFPFMSSPLQPILLVGTYLLLIYKILPEFMKNREPFKLDKILIAFNLSQVLVNAFLFYHAFLVALNVDWRCAIVDFSDSPDSRFILNMTYVYFCTKLADLLDTVFFILRGKNTQVSFLHVYHHCGMICLSWTGVRFLAGGHSLYLGLANTFVHMIMYFYYLVTIWKPEYKKNIWWKKHITHLQLIQFVFFIVMYGQLLFKPDCGYPAFVPYIIVPQNAFMITLFSDFYYKAYIKPKKVPKQQ